MANLNNPAGRLLYWLELAKGQSQDHSALEGWCQVFGLNASDPVDRVVCIGRGAQLMDLAVEARREADELPDQYGSTVLLAHLGQVEKALDRFTSLGRFKMSDFFQSVEGTGWQALAWLDEVLSKRRPEAVVEDTAIRDHIEGVRNLIDSILADGDLGDDLKRYILARLRDVEQALADAFITGVAGVELAVNSLFGASQREPDWWDRIAKTRWAPRIVGMWMAIVATLGATGIGPALMPGVEAAPPAPVESHNPEDEDPPSLSPDRTD